VHTSRNEPVKLGITVLVPTWRRPESLSRFLAGLEAQSRPPDELVLSVRADDEATRSLLATHPFSFPMRIATPARPGLLAALNAGYDAAGGDVVVATDDDTVPHPDWLERIEARFLEDPRLGALGGPDRMVLHDHPPDGIPGIVVGKVEPYGRVVGNHHLGAGEIRDVDIVKGCNFAIRAAALGDRRIDTRLRGTGAEHHTELDLCLGLRRAGWRIAYDPAVIVDHYEEARHEGSRETGKDAAENHDSTHNQTYALLKHLTPARKLASLAYGLLVGTQKNPGLAIAVAHRLGRGDPAGGSGLAVATSARLSAVGTWLRSLR
jgi:GT2 family glycosyltransferase